MPIEYKLPSKESVSYYLEKFKAWLETEPLDAHKAAGKEVYEKLDAFYKKIAENNGSTLVSTTILANINELAMLCAATPEILKRPNGLIELQEKLEYRAGQLYFIMKWSTTAAN